MLSEGRHILRDTGAASWDDRMFNVKVYCKIEMSPWALTLTGPVRQSFESPAADWPEKNFWPISEGEQPGDSGVFLHDVGFLINCHCWVAHLTGKVSRGKFQKKMLTNAEKFQKSCKQT